MKPFNLEEAKQGKPICTREGKPARIICFDRKENTYPIIALIDKGPFEVVYTYTNEGEYNFNGLTDFDLMMAPIKRKGWINLYKKDGINSLERIGCLVYSTKEEALDARNGYSGYAATTEIEWEE